MKKTKTLKKVTLILVVMAMVVGMCFAFTACGNKSEEKIIVYTNPFFAPFEYLNGTEIQGADIDIMNKVASDMGKKIEFQNVEFSIIIDEVASGKLCDVGAAGITKTEARAKKVNFSVPYYTSVQYVIAPKEMFVANKTSDGKDCIFWSQLAGKKIGVQLDTTGNIYVDLEINGEEGYPGALKGTNAKSFPMTNAQIAVESLKTSLDVVVVDELPAKYLTKNNNYVCLPLYYDAETATSEEYCIAVNKEKTELLASINKVLNQMIATKNAAGENEIEQLVSKHLGLN